MGTRAFWSFSGACFCPVPSRSLQEIPFSLKTSKGNISACKASGLTQNIIKGVVNPGNTVSAHSVAVQKNLGQTTVVGEWRTRGNTSHYSCARSVCGCASSKLSSQWSQSMAEPWQSLGSSPTRSWVKLFGYQGSSVGTGQSVCPSFFAF